MFFDNIPGLKKLNSGSICICLPIAGVGALLAATYVMFKPIIDQHVFTPFANNMSPRSTQGLVMAIWLARTGLGIVAVQPLWCRLLSCEEDG